MRICRWMLVLVLMLAGCGANALPSPVPLNEQALPSQQLEAVIGGQLDGQAVTIVAPAIQVGTSTTLVPALSLVNNLPTPLVSDVSASVAVAGDVSGLQPLAGGNYGVLRVAGTVQVGPNNQRTIAPTTIKVITPLSITLNELLINSSIYIEQVVMLRGVLIASQNEALLVEAVGAGGVPTTNAAQIKLTMSVADTALLDQLTQSGAVQYGPVEAVGVWRGKTLHLFWARPAP